ncbi:MAG: YceI family protein, partial [Myxococcales bacterium]
SSTAPHASPREKVEALIRGRHLKSFDLFVPVEKLKSGDKGLDTNMWKALKSDKFKDIGFHMESYEVRPTGAAGAAFTLAMKGRLTIAGIEQPVEVMVNAFEVTGGLRVAGSKDLLMTDYQIKPPTMMLGTIKTKNLITVKFDVQLRPSA